MRGAIVALLAGLIGDTPERFGVAGLAALLKQRVSLRERPAGKYVTAATHAHHQGHTCKGGYPEERPGEALAQETEQGRPLQVVQVEPLRDTFGIAQPSLVLERFVFFGHVNISGTARRARRSIPETRRIAARGPAARCAAIDANGAAPT